MPHVFWFVLVLGVVLAAAVQHGRAARAAGANPLRVRSPLHLGLNLAALIGSFALFPATILWHTWPFLVVVPTGFAIALRNMVYASKPAATLDESRREQAIALASAGALTVASGLVFLL